MELLYLWINRSKNRFIREKGINFSPEFNFIVEKKHDRYILKQDSKWTRKTSIFKNDVIENVTAIVGQNGSGKTTLLDYILDANILPVNEGSYSEGYEQLCENNRMDSLCLIIVREDEGKMVLYHNFKGGMIKTQISDIIEKNVDEQLDGFNEPLRIFVTNSYYNPQRGITGNSIALTPLGIEVLAQSFYNKLFRPHEDEKKKDYLIWCNAIRKMRNAEDFQRLCDLIYFNHLIEINGFESYYGKISTNINISSIDPLKCFKKIYDDYKDKQVLHKNFDNCCDKIITYKALSDIECDDITRNLILDLLIEFYLETNIDIPEDFDSYKQIKKWIRDNALYKYYEEGLQEIESLERLIGKIQSDNNIVPSYDMAYKIYNVFDYKEDRNRYKQLLNYINELFKKEKSFVLRYIHIEFPDMSSGERAFQNIFSWINLIPTLSKISMNKSISLRDEMLIMIDELDLYLHPSWQVKFIRYLLDEVQRQFKGKKIQIIIATHSPLCLSDIPRENTVYLSGKSNYNTFIVDDRKNHTQTFGRDIYSLLNDAFYLENSVMGSFAKKYIDGIITDINKLHDPNNTDRLNNIKELNNKIQYIGNDLLKHKLLNMLPRSLSDKEEKLYALRSQKELIEKQINELEKDYD